MDRVHIMKLGILEVVFVLALLLSPGETFGAEKPRRQQHFPLEVLEITRPPDVPVGASEICTQVLLHHVFGNTIDDAPVVRPYSPSPSCTTGQRWSRVVLLWTASSTGRQFDRISAVWLGGVEILRTCTAEPVKQPGGIQWTVEKDVTRYSSLWKRPQPVALELANVLSTADSLTGLYGVTLSITFYDTPGGAKTKEAQTTTTKLENFKPDNGAAKQTNSDGQTEAVETSTSASFAATVTSSGERAGADLILPFPSTPSSSSSTASDHWIRIDGESNQVQARRIRNIPRIAYRAVLEICVSSHQSDEFWYANKPNEYFEANNFTDAAFENGPFREILVTIDDDDDLPAGVVHPFPVIYTGGVNPFFWRPVTAIGSFVLSSYDVDVTPFLARLVDGEAHVFTLSVTNALPYWLLGLNLHIWVDDVDHDSSNTRGELTHHFTSISTSVENSNFMALDRTYYLKTSRHLVYSGWLLSSFGNLTTTVDISAEFSHALTIADSGNTLRVHQGTVTERTAVMKSDEKSLVYDYELYRFPLRFDIHQYSCGEGTLLQKASIDHSWEEELRHYQSRGVGGGSGYAGPSFFSTLKNRQQSRGRLVVPVVGENRGVAETRQSFLYDGSGGCYFRSLGVRNNGSYLFAHSLYLSLLFTRFAIAALPCPVVTRMPAGATLAKTAGLKRMT